MTLARKEDEIQLEQTRARISQTLKLGLQFETSTELSEKFLRRHVNGKVKLAVLFADIAGSTRMSITLPTQVLASIVQVFSQEMTLVVTGYGGYVLKYVGDAIIAFFPGEFDSKKACENAVNCAGAMMRIISECLNPAFNERDFPSIGIKIGIDFGENLVVLYGRDAKKSYIDIVGSSISVAAKITGIASPGQVVIGEDVYSLIDPELKGEFLEFKLRPETWNYTDARTGNIYKLYSTI
jgi:class 3 adenylate cyclase